MMHLLMAAALAVSGAATDPRVEAIVAAIAAYERSITAISWTERHFLPPSERDEPERSRLEWKGTSEERFVDEGWSWLLWQPSSRPAAPGADPPHRILFGTAGLRVTGGFDRREGMLGLTDAYFASTAHIGRFLGRLFDEERPSAGRSLERLIWRVGSVEFVAPTDDMPWPGIRARTTPPNRFHMDIEVRIDPLLGGMPRAILQRTPDGQLSRHSVVVEARAVGGLWLPDVCAFGSCYRAPVDDVTTPVPERRRRDIERARSGVGLPAEVNTPEVRRWIERFTEVRVIDAASGIVRAPLTIDADDPLVSPVLIVLERVELEPRPSIDELFDRLPAGARMFNGCTGEWTDVEGIRRFWKGLHQ